MKPIWTFIVLLSATFGIMGCDKLPEQPPGKLVFQTNRGLTKEEKISGIQRIATYSKGEMKIVYEGLVYLPRWHSKETISFQSQDRNDPGKDPRRINKRLTIISLSGKVIKEISIDQRYHTSDYAWQPDGKRFASIESESGYYAKLEGRRTTTWDANRVSLYDSETGKREELINADKYKFTRISFSSDGRLLALARRLAGENNKGKDKDIVILDLLTQKMEVVLENTTVFDWATTSDTLLFQEFRKAGTFWAHSVMGTYDLTTKKKKFFHKPPLFTFSAIMAPDDQSVIYHEAGNTDKLWWVSTRGGKRKLFLDYSKSTENNPIEDMFHDWTV